MSGIVADALGHLTVLVEAKREGYKPYSKMTKAEKAAEDARRKKQAKIRAPRRAAKERKRRDVAGVGRKQKARIGGSARRSHRGKKGGLTQKHKKEWWTSKPLSELTDEEWAEVEQKCEKKQEATLNQLKSFAGVLTYETLMGRVEGHIEQKQLTQELDRLILAYISRHPDKPITANMIRNATRDKVIRIPTPPEDEILDAFQRMESGGYVTSARMEKTEDEKKIERLKDRLEVVDRDPRWRRSPDFLRNAIKIAKQERKDATSKQEQDKLDKEISDLQRELDRPKHEKKRLQDEIKELERRVAATKLRPDAVVFVRGLESAAGEMTDTVTPGMAKTLLGHHAFDPASPKPIEERDTQLRAAVDWFAADGARLKEILRIPPETPAIKKRTKDIREYELELEDLLERQAKHEAEVAKRGRRSEANRNLYDRWVMAKKELAAFDKKKEYRSAKTVLKTESASLKVEKRRQKDKPTKTRAKKIEKLEATVEKWKQKVGEFKQERDVLAARQKQTKANYDTTRAVLAEIKDRIEKIKTELEQLPKKNAEAIAAWEKKVDEAQANVLAGGKTLQQMTRKLERIAAGDKRFQYKVDAVESDIKKVYGNFKDAKDALRAG